MKKWSKGILETGAVWKAKIWTSAMCLWIASSLVWPESRVPIIRAKRDEASEMGNTQMKKWLVCHAVELQTVVMSNIVNSIY